MASPGSSLAHRSTENLQDCRRNMKQRARQKGSTWFLGSWNERSLLDYEGPVETARQYLHLTVETKSKVYQACVLSILFYGAECWTPLRKDLKRLDSFHHRCIRSTLGITNQQQWDNHITSQSIRRQWGDMETVSDKVFKRRLEWLGHLARMPDKHTYIQGLSVQLVT